MEENKDTLPQEETAFEEEEEQAYVPRPASQVWAARVGVVVMVLLVIYQLLQIAGVGR